MHTIKWTMKATGESFISPSLFSRKDAAYLAEEANKHFTRAHHVVIPAQEHAVQTRTEGAE